MNGMKTLILGNLDIFCVENEDELNGEVVKWNEVLIHGDPEGLKSFAQLLLNLADLDQNKLITLPDGAREHIHLIPNADLSKSSVEVIVGRLNAKGSGEFYGRYVRSSQQEPL